MAERHKVVIIGLDGASFNFIAPYCREGIMPNLNRFWQSGSSGDLASAYPPITPAAWTSFMTGKLPGKHHVLDFEQFNLADGSLRYNTSSDIKAATLWQIVSQGEGRVAVINVPMTYPPQAVNGILVAGHNVPNAESEYCYPADFKPQLLGEIPDYMQVKTKWHGLKDDGGFDRFIESKNRLVDHYLEAFQFVDQKVDWDLSMLVFPQTDMGHMVWEYMDPDHLHDSSPRRRRVLDIFTHLDDALGKLFALAERKNATVVIMSDHGHGKLLGHVRANILLKQWGYLKLGSPLQWLGRRLVREYHKFRTPNKYRRPARLVEEKLGIDWSRTRAVVAHTAEWGFLYLNVKGRRENGLIEPGEEYEKIRAELIERFQAELDPDTGEKLFAAIYKSEDIYGAAAEAWNCPDLVLRPQEGMKVNRKTRENWVVRYQSDDEIIGTHLHNGLWMAAGPGVAPGKHFAAAIQDIAPTVLALMNLPVPEDMDGRVLEDILTPETQVRYTAAAADRTGAAPSVIYSPEEEKQIQQNLADLGYFD